MKQVYAPANGPEAHMLVHLLGQAGITAHIHGEALQLAAGDLPVGGTLQILVPDEDYGEARRLLLDWEKAEAPAQAAEQPAKRRFPTAAVVFLVIGMGSGWLLKSIMEMNHFSIGDHVTQEDRNGDGRPDSTWYFAPGSRHSYKGEFDHNHDGSIDARTFYDGTGTATEQDEDQDFNGTFETKEFFRSGVIVRSEVDTDGDHIPDYTAVYIDGVLRWDEIIDPRLGSVVRLDNFANHRLISADLDLDRDGFRETRRTFDRFGEIIRTEPIAR